MMADKIARKNKYAWLESLYVLILGMYPMRHIYMGLDMWDTGYNYANFQYMGMDHMDSMWLFSTYLANAVGNFLMKLPGAGSLAGMNFYTGLFVSALALIGYFFCTKKVKIPPVMVFVGEFTAISLCWCPTAKLYDYMTYLFFLISIILLYLGLTKEKKWYLFAAGICLGVNVLVRFSNLPEAAMIVAVWACGVIEALEWRKKCMGMPKDERVASGAWSRTVGRTLWCLGGYLSALVVLFGYIGIRYGLDEYIAGIQRLFAMTDDATDYKATSMLTGLINTYVRETYWLVRILLIMLAGMVGLCIVRTLFRYAEAWVTSRRVKRIFEIFCYAVSVLLGLVTLGWLYKNGFCSLAFYSYDAMLRPGILFLMLTMGIALLRIFHRGVSKEEKLFSGMVLLVILLTSIGSNTGVYPSLNNLFLAAPYTFWQVWRFIRGVKEWEINLRGKLRVSVSPLAAKGIVTAFLALFLFQSTCFGAVFVFAESTGVRDISATVENNKILKGIQMSEERAGWLSSISAYVDENDLQGREVILFGEAPALSYYLQMPPAFNPWSELRSYSAEQMKKDMQEMEEEMNQGAQRPVIIVDKIRLDYLQDGAKWKMILDFMDEYDYQQTFENDRFIIWE